MRLTLQADGTGTLVIGEDAPLPPVPTDPDVGPGFTSGRSVRRVVFEGFPYSVHASSVEDRRLRLGAELREPYRPWCELQPSYRVLPDSGHYQCVPNGSTHFSGNGDQCSHKPGGDGEWIPIDCEKLSLCSGAMTCTCDAAGCTVPSSEILDDQSLRLDAALFEEGDELIGTLVVTDFDQEVGRPTVRFTRN